MKPIINEITVAPKIVRITNWRPTTLNANAKRIKLRAYCVTATGISNGRYFCDAKNTNQPIP